MAALTQHELYRNVGGKSDDNNTIIAACDAAVRAFSTDAWSNRYISVYHLFNAISPNSTFQHDDVMKLVFGLANARDHYNPAAMQAELYTSHTFAKVAPHVCIMFIPKSMTNAMRDFFSNVVEVLLQRESTPPPQNVSRYNNNTACTDCLVDFVNLFPHEQAVKRCSELIINQGNGVSEDPSHFASINGRKIHIPVPHMFLAFVLVMLTISSALRIAPEYTYLPLSNTLEHQLSLHVMLAFAAAITAAAVKNPVLAHFQVYLHSRNLEPFQPGIDDVIQRLVLLGMYDKRGFPTKQHARNMMDYNNAVVGINGVRSPLITGLYSMEEARRMVFEEGSTRPELLSMVCATGVTWMLDGFANTNTDISELIDYRTGKISLSINLYSQTIGEHATCSALGKFFVKWQPVYSFEIASIIKATSGPTISNLATEPTHVVTLVAGTNIHREYNNYQALVQDSVFFCQPLFGIICSAERLDTSPIKKAPETHFRTSFAELSLVTMYHNFGPTLRIFLDLSILRNPIKAIVTLCFIFLRRLEATESVWPDMHDRNVTVRLAPENGQITMGGRTIHVVKGEQIVGVIDHGDDTPSRGVLYQDKQRTIEAACGVFYTMIWQLINAHKYNFQVVLPRDDRNAPSTDIIVMGNVFDSDALPDDGFNVYRNTMSDITLGFLKHKAIVSNSSFRNGFPSFVKSNKEGMNSIIGQDLTWMNMSGPIMPIRKLWSEGQLNVEWIRATAYQLFDTHMGHTVW